MEIVHATGVDGARSARGVVVVIDVLRSFTVSAYALAGGARECLLVSTVDEALALAARTPDAVVCAEVDGLPVPGIAAVTTTEGMLAGSFVVAGATAQACLLRSPEVITLIASADFPEDHACAQYLEALLRGAHEDVDSLLAPLRHSERYHMHLSGTWPGFPATDIELALAIDRFDFAMPATRRDGHLRLTRGR